MPYNKAVWFVSIDHHSRLCCQVGLRIGSQGHGLTYLTSHEFIRISNGIQHQGPVAGHVIVVLTDVEPLSKRQTNPMTTPRNDFSEHRRLTHAPSCTPVVYCANKIVPIVCCTSCQRLQQRLGLLQINRVKALAEPAVDLCQELVGFSTFALALPQSTQAHRRAQLQGSRLLAAGHGESLTKTGFRLSVTFDKAR